MGKWRFQLLSLLFVGGALRAAPESIPAPAAALANQPARVVVIKVHDQIGSAVHYIVRRGLKEAIAERVDTVVLDIKTPGGSLDSTLKIMEAIAQFPGTTIAYVNNEAMSASFFNDTATTEIWFAPDGVIGAAAPVDSSGAAMDETMRLKIVSYLKARMRAVTEGRGYRGQVIAAMIDPTVELKIGESILKPKGELLSLTATEASQAYGDPARPLLAAGIAKDFRELFEKKFGPRGYVVRHLETTWSEGLAAFLNRIAPVLLGLGLMALFIEFKTPGFGMFGIAGIVLLAVVFISNFVAGLSGHEPMLVFVAGLLLIVAELFFFPGGVVLALAGLILMAGSLLWSMADIWPHQPLVISHDLLAQPLQTLLLALVIGGVTLAMLYRFLPRGWIWDRLAVGGAVLGTGMSPEVAAEKDALVGREGVAVTSLFPSGQVEIGGRRYEARLEVDFAEAGTAVRVLRRTDFGVIVEIKKT